MKINFKKIEELLNRYGYELICINPLEIEDKNTASFASGEFAELVIENLKIKDKKYQESKGAKIYEQLLYDKYGTVVGNLAVLCGGLKEENPTGFMNKIVSDYVGKRFHNQFVEMRLDNPWTRVIIEGIDKLDLIDYNEYKLKNNGE